MGALIPTVIGIGQAAWGVVSGIGGGLATMATGGGLGAGFSQIGTSLMGGLSGLGTTALNVVTQNTGYEWLTTGIEGGPTGFERLLTWTKTATDYESYRKQKDAIKRLKNTNLDIPSMADFERNRDEQMEILDTDPSQLTSRFSEAQLRRHGIDPGSADAKAMLEKRGFRSQMEQQQDEMSRMYGRSGVMGNAALAAASAQLGIQGASYDAQLGQQAEQMFTQQLSNVQQKWEANTNQLMSMEESMAQWEFNKQAQIAAMERQWLSDTSSMLNKAIKGMKSDREAKGTGTSTPEPTVPTPPFTPASGGASGTVDNRTWEEKMNDFYGAGTYGSSKPTTGNRGWSTDGSIYPDTVEWWNTNYPPINPDESIQSDIANRQAELDAQDHSEWDQHNTMRINMGLSWDEYWAWKAGGGK